MTTQSPEKNPVLTQAATGDNGSNVVSTASEASLYEPGSFVQNEDLSAFSLKAEAVVHTPIEGDNIGSEINSANPETEEGNLDRKINIVETDNNDHSTELASSSHLESSRSEIQMSIAQTSSSSSMSAALQSTLINTVSDVQVERIHQGIATNIQADNAHQDIYFTTTSLTEPKTSIHSVTQTVNIDTEIASSTHEHTSTQNVVIDTQAIIQRHNHLGTVTRAIDVDRQGRHEHIYSQAADMNTQTIASPHGSINTQPVSFDHHPQTVSLTTQAITSTAEDLDRQSGTLDSQTITLVRHISETSSSLGAETIPNNFLVNTPQGFTTIEGSTVVAPNQGQVLLVQMPNADGENQVVLARVSSTEIQNSPVVIPGGGSVHAQGGSTDVSDSSPSDVPVKKRGRGRGRIKSVNKDQPKPPLRPLAPRMYAVPVSAPTVLLTPSPAISNGLPHGVPVQPFNSVSGPILAEAGQYFEVLGRCISCFRFCRTTTYCRAEKGHRDVRASSCEECEGKGYSTVVCRRKFQHKVPNANPPNVVINTALQRAEDVKEVCVRNLLPPCFGDLHSITVHHADTIFAQPKTKEDFSDQLLNLQGMQQQPQGTIRKATDYARGYFYPYTKETWDQWLLKFCLQTGTNYRIRTGKRVNKKTDHGLANHNGKVVVYRALESQLYNCSLGGKPRKKKLRDGARRRKERGSKLIGCSAVIHTRLIETEENWRALEVTVPKLSAHLPTHDPRVNNEEMTIDINELLLSQHLNTNQLSREGQQFDLMEGVLEGESEEAEEDAGNSVVVNLRRQTRNLFVNCAGLIETVQSVEVLKAVNEHAQVLYNQILKSSNPQASNKRTKRQKRTAQEANLEDNSVELEPDIGHVALLEVSTE